MGNKFTVSVKDAFINLIRLLFMHKKVYYSQRIKRELFSVIVHSPIYLIKDSYREDSEKVFFTLNLGSNKTDFELSKSDFDNEIKKMHESIIENSAKAIVNILNKI